MSRYREPNFYLVLTCPKLSNWTRRRTPMNTGNKPVTRSKAELRNAENSSDKLSFESYKMNDQ